ncbi:MAG: preprotein translocase subunit SecG [Planctomycetota bacterium]|nr:MAG: preprotein translocase subunit SecG [Planctomycetota bacterium]
MTLIHYIIAFLFVVICILLMIVILLQKGRGGGLSGAFGGVGGHSAFGAKTGDVFTWVTVALTFLFVLVSIIGVFWFVPPPAAVTTPAQVAPPSDAQPSEAVPERGESASDIPVAPVGE